MKLKCIDSDAAADHLTEGNVYEAISFLYKSSGEVDRVKVVDDNGAIWLPFIDRFEIVEP